MASPSLNARHRSMAEPKSLDATLGFHKAYEALPMSCCCVVFSVLRFADHHQVNHYPQIPMIIVVVVGGVIDYLLKIESPITRGLGCSGASRI